MNKTTYIEKMDTTKIKRNQHLSTSSIKNNMLDSDKININESLRDKLNKMIRNTGTAEKLKTAEKIAENTVKLGFEKAVAHFENPAMYPLPAESRNLETAVFNLLNVMPKKKRNKLIDKVNELLKAPAEKRKQVYGEIVNLDFRSNKPIAEQVKGLPGLKKYSLDAGELEDLERSLNNIIKSEKQTPLPQQAAASTKLSLIVDNMTCKNPDDILKDEISIGGFILDSLGNTIELAPRFIGKFRKDETINLGANSTLFTVNIDPFLAEQTFSANLFLIESDLVENQDLLDKVVIVLAIIGFTLALVSLGIVIAGTLGAAVTLTQFFITFFGGLLISGIGSNIIPLLGDDISNVTTDTLVINGIIGIGTEFTRTLEIGQGFDAISTFDGKYTANARWVGQA